MRNVTNSLTIRHTPNTCIVFCKQRTNTSLHTSVFSASLVLFNAHSIHEPWAVAEGVEHKWRDSFTSVLSEIKPLKIHTCHALICCSDEEQVHLQEASVSFPSRIERGSAQVLGILPWRSSRMEAMRDHMGETNKHIDRNTNFFCRRLSWDATEWKHVEPCNNPHHFLRTLIKSFSEYTENLRMTLASFSLKRTYELELLFQWFQVLCCLLSSSLWTFPPRTE